MKFQMAKAYIFRIKSEISSVHVDREVRVYIAIIKV